MEDSGPADGGRGFRVVDRSVEFLLPTHGDPVEDDARGTLLRAFET